MNRRLAPLATLAAAGLALAACSSGIPSGTSSSGKVTVVAAFYPLEYAAQRVGGDAVEVTNLVRPGAEAHDLELAPQDVATVRDAGLTVYVKGVQPALDKAIEESGGENAYDVSPEADLSQAAASADDHAGDHGGAAQGHAAGQSGKDPHFWLDPIRYGAVVIALAHRLGEVDPAHQADYQRNATALLTDLNALDRELEQGLATCTSKTLVTSHAAFGYLADRYGLTQHPIAGLSPEQEPSAARMAEIASFVRANSVRTIYTETLVSPAIGQTLAKETNVATAVLDPLEGLSDASAGSNYLEVMRANLATLKKGQPCP